jgi:DnaK suppressor protein
MKKKSKKTLRKISRPVKYPMRLVRPVGLFLSAQLKRLEKRRKSVAESDPFLDVDRITDNAAPDADAEEQFGHARVSAIKEQLDRKIIQTRRALSRVRIGKYGICERCGKMIDTDRLIVYPEATFCIECESKREKKRK